MTCADQFTANKATNANGGLKWIEKGGGYYSECVSRLKGVNRHWRVGPAIGVRAGGSPDATDDAARGRSRMIASLSLILLCQLAGEVFVRGLGLPVPGPVVGLVFLLLLLLLARDRFAVLARGPLQGDGVENASRGLLAHLSLLFVPAGVGVVQKLDLDRRAWHRHHRRARDLRGGDAAGDGGDVFAREPPDGARTERAMSENPFSLWVYLSQSPLLWLTVTLLAYAIADAVSLATQPAIALANPVLHSMWIIGAFLLLTGTSYTTYFGGAQFVHFLLGPATVALAVPLYENRKVVAAAILPMLAALVVGSVTAIVSVVLLAEAAGLPRDGGVVAGAEIGDRGRRDGHQRIAARRSVADGGRGGPHRHHGRDHRDALDEPDAASPISAPAASPSASRRTASVPRARFRSTRSRACSPASP